MTQSNRNKESIRAGVLTLSDKGARGEREDTSGPLVREMLAGIGATIEIHKIIPDQQDQIKETLLHWTDRLSLDLIVTTGGTGVSPTDVTPEATKEIIEKELPGISEAMRQASLKITPHAMLSRSICGIRGRCLIINLPGSRKAAKENLATILPAIGHAVYKIKGGMQDCGSG